MKGTRFTRVYQDPGFDIPCLSRLDCSRVGRRLSLLPEPMC